MNNAADFTKMYEKFFTAGPADMSAFNDAFKNATDLAGKFGKIALDAAEKNADLSQAWTKETLTKLEDLTKTNSDPSEYAKVVSDVAKAQAEATPEKLAAFAEVTKKAQMDTFELMLAAGKEVQSEAANAVKKAAKKAA